jgi:hypothetical protein
MIGHLVIAVLVFAGVLGPIELYCEWSYRRERRRRDERARRVMTILERKPTPAVWKGDAWAYRGFGERVAR